MLDEKFEHKSLLSLKLLEKILKIRQNKKLNRKKEKRYKKFEQTLFRKTCYVISKIRY